MKFATILCLLPLALAAKQKALLVGINNYKNPKDRLAGCINDIEAIRSLLISKFGFRPEDIAMLKDSQATTGNIEKKFRDHLIKGITKDDSVVFYFSGHGTLAPDLNGDETDGKDEIICTYDLDPRKISTWFTDDRMNHLINQLPTAKAWITFDCCHSGTANRSLHKEKLPEGFKARYMEIGFEEHDTNSPKRSIKATDKTNSQNMHPPKGAHTFFSACQANQTAVECSIGGKQHGILTSSLLFNLSKDPNQKISSLKSKTELFISTVTKKLKNKQRPYFSMSTPNITMNKLLDGFSKDLIPYTPPKVNQPEFKHYYRKGDIKVDLSLSQQTFKPGEKLRLQLRASQDCFVRLYHYGVDNSVTQIFPNKFSKNNIVKKDKPLLFPQKGASYTFELSEPFGNEIIKAVVSKTQFTDIAANANFNNGFSVYNDSNLKTSSDRGVPNKKQGYGENITIYSIQPKK